MHHWGNVYWPIWLGLVAISFGTPEGYAIANNTYNTFSDWFWRVVHVSRPGISFTNHTALWFFTLMFYIGGSVWLAWHLWGRNFR